MNILHLSDLHVTRPFNNLDEVWNGPSAVVASEVYDFILVSGDLSQRAGEEEYQQLLAFTAKLLEHVHDRDPRRVIFVPGNHDVDWGADLGQARPFKDVIAEVREEPRAFLQKVLQDPMSSGYRARLSEAAEVEVIKLVASRYPSRFARVQRFLDSFYVDLAGRADFRGFKLTDPDETRHFSAHIFAREGVAFYGFNSCHGNDRYWTGAYISRTAINAAAEHARTHAKDMLHVAVWHHGLSGTPGRPDRLTMLDIGALHNAGFRIGFHGHTHRAETETLDRFFGDRFTVISTGSIGAGAAERPDAVGNQFSLVRLHLGQVTVTVYERDGEHGVFAPREPRFHLLPLEPLRPARLRHVRRHQLSWTVLENGIADLEVAFEKLTTDGPVTLARVPAAAGNVRGDAAVETPLGALPVIDATHPDGRRELTFQTQGAVLEKAAWRARVAHAVALDAQELTLLPRGRVVTAALPPNEEGVCCEIDLATDVLEVTVRLPKAGPGVERAPVACVVERRRNDGGADRWERVPEEEHRCKNAVVMVDTHTLTATLEAPLVGYRYTFAWRPMPRRDVAWDDDAFAVSRWVIERCRRGHFGEPGWSHKLAHTVSEGIAASLDGFEGARIAWMGFLWLEEERSLLAAFGRGPSSLWGARFPAGTGVAGHAFRFGLPAVWHQRGAPEASMIYRPSSESRSILGIEYPYQWIVCVPIVTHARQPIGVVSMSGGPPETDAEFLMATLAERARKGTLNDELTQVQNSLVAAVNYGFWHTLARTPLGEQSPPFPEYLRRRAEQEESWVDADFSERDDTDAR